MLIKENEVKRTRGLTDGVPPQEAASRHYAWPGSQDKANSAGDQRRSEAYPPRQLPAARSEKRASTNPVTKQPKVPQAFPRLCNPDGPDK